MNSRDSSLRRKATVQNFTTSRVLTSKPVSRPEGNELYFDCRVETLNPLGDSSVNEPRSPRSDNRLVRFLREENRLMKNQLEAKTGLFERLHNDFTEKNIEATEMAVAAGQLKSSLARSESNRAQLLHEIDRRNLRIQYLEDKLREAGKPTNDMRPCREQTSSADLLGPQTGIAEELRAQLDAARQTQAELEQKLQVESETLAFCRDDNAKLQAAYQDLLAELGVSETKRAELASQIERLRDGVIDFAQGVPAPALEDYPDLQAQLYATLNRPRVCQPLNLQSFSGFRHKSTPLLELRGKETSGKGEELRWFREELEELAKLIGMPRESHFIAIGNDRDRYYRDLFVGAAAAIVAERAQFEESLNKQRSEASALQQRDPNDKNGFFEPALLAPIGENLGFSATVGSPIDSPRAVELRALRLDLERLADENAALRAQLSDSQLPPRASTVSCESTEPLEEAIRLLVEAQTTRAEEAESRLEELNVRLAQIEDFNNDLSISNQKLKLELMQVPRLKKELENLQNQLKRRKEDGGSQTDASGSLSEVSNSEIERLASENAALGVKLKGCERALAVMKEENVKLCEFISVLKTAPGIKMSSEPSNESSKTSQPDSKARIHELQSRVAQTEFETQIFKTKSGNLEAEVEALKRENRALRAESRAELRLEPCPEPRPEPRPEPQPESIPVADQSQDSL